MLRKIRLSHASMVMIMIAAMVVLVVSGDVVLIWLMMVVRNLAANMRVAIARRCDACQEYGNRQHKSRQYS